MRLWPSPAPCTSSRQSGKSTTVGVMALHVACFEPDSLIVIASLGRATLCLVDEASRIDDDLMGAIRPMLEVNSRGTLIMLSMPAGSAERFTIFGTTAIRHGRASAFPHPCARASARNSSPKNWRELGPTRFAEEYELAFIDDVTAAFSTSTINSIVDPNLRIYGHELLRTTRCTARSSFNSRSQAPPLVGRL